MTGYNFDREILILNNTSNPDSVSDALEEFATEEVYYALDLAHKFSGINYKLEYALGEMVAIYVVGADPESCTDYLCYVQGDCITDGGDWVTPGIAILESESDVMIVSPASEVNTWHDKEGYDHYMSDQAWLVRVNDFANPEIYKVGGIDPDYPDYGGNSFEHMVGKYLKKSGKKRKILKDFYTFHPTY